MRKVDRNDDKLIDRNEIVAAVRMIDKHVARATLRWLQVFFFYFL
ncbi:unnamed protein product [Gongylonema pulchrum]|uniref:EF-hand domain-containing protein n=1 Tax=Gongylonema pulchrum TaxID=637853 RepID=A0A183DKD5_9BILA|nr:unnamed protein product [Gongylonema pulchrum]